MIFNGSGKIKDDGGDYCVLTDYGYEGFSVTHQDNTLDGALKWVTDNPYGSPITLVKLVRVSTHDEDVPNDQVERTQKASKGETMCDQYRDCTIRRGSECTETRPSEVRSDALLASPSWWNATKLQTIPGSHGHYAFWHHDQRALRFNGWMTLDEMKAIVASIEANVPREGRATARTSPRDCSVPEAPIAEDRATKQARFRDELETLLNANSMENGCDTPDFILADYLLRCLQAFDAAVERREEWYGRSS